MLEAARFRSPSGRKLTTGLAILISRKTSAPRQTTNRTASVCALPKGSLYQSHSCPLLSSTSHEDIIRVSSPSPIVSKRDGRRRSSARSCLRYSGSSTAKWHIR